MVHSSTYPILYSFRRCPYAMRARLALYLKKIPHEHREVSLKNKPNEMLAISPKGTVPVLQLQDGTVLEESLDIMNWALNTPNLSVKDQELITENDTTFKQALDRYKYPGRYSEETGINYREQCELFLAKLEVQLNPSLIENTSTFTDLALFPFVRQFSRVNPEWFNEQPYPILKAWLNFFSSNSLFQKVMKNYPLWAPNSSPVLVNF